MKSNRIFISWLRWPLFIRIGVIILCLILLFGQIIYILELSSSLRYSKAFGGLSLRFRQSVMETMCRTRRWDRQPEYC